MDGCIFCKIIKKEIPATILYQDEQVTAFLDIAPINLGHILVIPNEHHCSASTIPEAVAGHLFKVATELGIALKRACNADAYNLHLADGTAAGQVVMHAHLHVVPRFIDDHFHWNWRQLAYASPDAMNEMKATILSKFRLPTESAE